MSKTFFYFKTNLRLLRQRKKLSQEELAQQLNITRAKLAALESGQTKAPQPEDYIHISEFFKISIDALLKSDLRKLTELKLRSLEAGNDTFLNGSKIRVLAISTNSKEEENTEYVPAKAKMGYRSGYNDPEYIAQLPKFSLPNLPRHNTYRIFPSTGESMLPIKPGTDFITEYVADWTSLKEAPCVVVLKSAGADFVFKIVSYRPEQRDFLLSSLNEDFEPYTVSTDEILEIWKYYKHITDELPEKQPGMRALTDMIEEIKTLLLKSNHK